MNEEANFIDMFVAALVGIAALTVIITLNYSTKGANATAMKHTQENSFSQVLEERGTYDDEDVLTKVANRDGKRDITGRAVLDYKTLIMSRDEVITQIYAAKDSAVKFIVGVTDMSGYTTLEAIKSHVPDYNYTKESAYDYDGNLAVVTFTYIPN